MTLLDAPSPNHDERRSGRAVEILLLHYTGMVSAEAALAHMQNPASKVSAHYLIDEAGRVFQLVDEAQRAWHAGLGSWRGDGDINSRSVGIELANPGHEWGYRPFPAAQMQALVDVASDIIKRHGIEPRNVLGHSDIAPSRKEDPGEYFDWAALAKKKIGLFPCEPLSIPPDFVPLRPGIIGTEVASLQADLLNYGWECPQTGRFDLGTHAAICAFQRHFRSARIDGVWDGDCAARLATLINSIDSARPGV